MSRDFVPRPRVSKLVQIFTIEAWLSSYKQLPWKALQGTQLDEEADNLLGDNISEEVRQLSLSMFLRYIQIIIIFLLYIHRSKV